MDPRVEALLAERAGYVARGLPDRVAAVDAELERAGYVSTPVETTAEEEPPERAVPPRPRKR